MIITMICFIIAIIKNFLAIFIYFWSSAEDAVREKDEETLAAQEAASAAVMANMRRAELDAELSELIGDLIDYKATLKLTQSII